MIRFVIILAVSAMVHAQSALVKRGGEIYRFSCGVLYCHGAEGTAGRAPQLAGRVFNPQKLLGVIMSGRPGTSMPGFSQQMNSDDIVAVTQYVLSLAGSTGVENGPAKPASTEMLPEPPMGRALFFDAAHMGGCGTCHELGDRGSPVGPNLKALAVAPSLNLRTASHTRVVTARPVGEDPFPAIQVEQTPELIKVYDLTSPLPVLRTFQAAQVRITPGNAWSHETAVQSYSDRELEFISNYLTWLVRTQPEK